MEEGMQLIKQNLFHIHKIALGVLWSWTQEVVCFNGRRELKLKLKKNTTADMFLMSQTITHHPCSGMLARLLGHLRSHNLFPFSYRSNILNEKENTSFTLSTRKFLSANIFLTFSFEKSWGDILGEIGHSSIKNGT